MLFNGMFAFGHFPMLFNGNLWIEKLGWGMYGRTDGCKKIHPCVLHDIGPLGPLLKKAWEGRYQAWENLGEMDGWKNRQMKVSCVLQYFVPFGAAALLSLTLIHDHAKQGNRYRWPYIALGQPVLFLGSGPKGPLSCRTQGWISFRPFVRTYVRLSVRPPPKLINSQITIE